MKKGRAMTLPFLFASDWFHLHGQMQHLLVSHHIPFGIDEFFIHRRAVYSADGDDSCKIAHPVGVPEHKLDFHTTVTGYNLSVQATHESAYIISYFTSLTRANGESPLGRAALDVSFCRPDKSAGITGGCHFSLEGTVFDDWLCKIQFISARIIFQKPYEASHCPISVHTSDKVAVFHFGSIDHSCRKASCCRCVMA